MAAPFTPDPARVTGDATPAVDPGAMNEPGITPPPGLTVNPHLTLPEILREAASLIDEADDAGLAVPYGAHVSDYGVAECTFYLHKSDNADIWGALRGWAERYHVEVDTYPASTPGSLHAKALFRHGGVRFEASAVISTDDRPPDASQGGQ